MTVSDKTTVDRALALAIAELIQQGGNEKDVRQLVRQFQVIADDKAAEAESKTIPE